MKRHICLAGFNVCNDCLLICHLKERHKVTLIESFSDVLVESRHDRPAVGYRLRGILASVDVLVLDSVSKSRESPTRRSFSRLVDFLDVARTTFPALSIVLVEMAPEADVERRAKLFEAGVKEYVVYPYDSSEVLRLILKRVRSTLVG
ncbi:MAG: hypothetical protein P4L84_29545 [Isosphaeraceae bacterium]|nr:hypothetical protein [Isosphaeraceae bacterium]